MQPRCFSLSWPERHGWPTGLQITIIRPQPQPYAADVPSGSRIISNELWWFPLYDENREFLSDYYFFLGRYQSNFDFATEFEEYAPDYVLIDDQGFGCSEATIPEYLTYREIVSTTCEETAHYSTGGFSHDREYTLFTCEN